MTKKQLTILQVNDLHGYLEPHPEVFRGPGRFSYRTCGGLARVAAIFDRVRVERAGAVLALDNGDTFHGTFVPVQSRGEAMLALLNALAFDAMTLHWEFAYGPAQVRKLATGLDYPTLAINVYDFKMENPKGHRIEDLLVDGEPVQPGRRYRAAMLGEQGVPAKYGSQRHQLDIDAIEALQQLFAHETAVRGSRRGTVVAV